MDVHYLDYKEGATTVRPPAFAELLVDSLDRYGAQNPKNKANDSLELLKREIENKIPSNNFDFQKNQAQLSGYFTRIAITDLEIDWRTPNFNERNDTFLLTVYNSPSFSTVQRRGFAQTIPTGFYDGTELASTLNANFATGFFTSSLSSIGVSGVSASWNASTAQLSLSCPGVSTSIVLNENPTLLTNVNGTASTVQEVATSDYRFLTTIKATGDFLEKKANPGGNVSSIGVFSTLTTQPTNLCYTNYVDIVSNSLTKYARVKDNMTRLENPIQSVVARVYMNAYGTNNPMGDSQATEPHTIAVDYTTPKYIRWNPSEYLNNFDLSLFDEYGELLFWDKKYSTEYRLTIQASES